jgi:hypothetical protein
MAIPSHQLIDPDYPMHYHIVSRCVRRDWLCVVDRLQTKPAPSIRLEEFLNILKRCEAEYRRPPAHTKTCRWYNRIASLRKRQRAFGAANELSAWRTDRG